MQEYLRSFKGDLFGGVTAAVVGLPVALAFGEASGLGALAGIYGAIAVGFFAAVFGGTRSQISGPTGPMAVAMAVVVTLHADNLAAAFTIVIMAGLFQVLLGVVGIGRFIAFTPYSVISGFMSGIGIIIILLQTLPSMGMPVAEGGPIGAIKGWGEGIANFNTAAFAIAAVTLAVGILWPARFRRILPPTLVALGVGTMMSVLWLTDVPVIGSVPTGLPAPQLPDLSPGLLAGAITPALTIAMLGSIDSLLTSLIADSMTRTQHHANRELIGQGIGNMAAGFLGGLPGAGATMGTVINIRAGGRTQVSGVVRAGILLALVLGLAKYVEVIPHACLAGILLKVGWDIIDWRFLGRIVKVQREHLLVMALTLFLTVFVDLVTAVAIGLIAAGMATSRQFERLQLDSVVSVPLLDSVFFKGAYRSGTVEPDDFSARVGMVGLRGAFTVASSQKLISTISKDVSEHEVVIFDFTSTAYMDDSAALVVEELIDAALNEDTECIVMGLTSQPELTMLSLNALKRIPEDHFAEDMDGAREIAARLLGLEPTTTPA
ncbi:MAG: SulP family inorganic anion transporter [Chloroflexi bacterium]|nr:SulP family inorganic anion transporter [Chloroflexota bacterium]